MQHINFLISAAQFVQLIYTLRGCPTQLQHPSYGKYSQSLSPSKKNK